MRNADSRAGATRTTGSSVKDAVTTLRTARRVDSHGAIADAMRAGELSAPQANAIADACVTDPQAEKQLLAHADSASLQELRDECRRVKTAARSNELEHDDAIRRTRFLRTWTDAEGAGRGEWKLPPEAQARLLARLDTETEGLVQEAKQAGAPIESRDAHMADALVRVAGSGGGDTGSKVAIHLRVDHAAFERGHTEPDDVCEIEGVGPVPVATARNLSTDALIYVLATKGTEITHYAEHGRYIPKALRLALEARDAVCVALGCNVRDNLEIHPTPSPRPPPLKEEALLRRQRWRNQRAELLPTVPVAPLPLHPPRLGRSATPPKPAGRSTPRPAARHPTR